MKPIDIQSLREADLETIGSLSGLAVLTVAARAYIFPSVFRKGDVLLLANDPYLYRFTVEQIVAELAHGFDVVGLYNYADFSLYSRDPLFLMTLSWLTELAGGDPPAAGLVLAWFPVAASHLTVFLVYEMTRRLTESHWIGIVAGSLLAISPVHVLRTALGYADHHAFDYIWLALTAYLLVLLAYRSLSLSSHRTWALSIGLGFAIAGQVFSWIAGPLFVVPIGLYIAIRSVYDVRMDAAPLRSNAPILIGIAVSVVLAWLGRSLLDQLPFELPPTIYPLLLLLLLGGSIGILGVAELVRSYELPAATIVVAQLLGLLVGIVGLQTVLAADVNFETAFSLLANLWTAGGAIAETVSIFGGPVGPITGPFSLFGLIFFLAIPYLALAVRAGLSDYRPEWMVIVSYAIWFLLLASVQRRFAGELSLYIAPFAAIGLVDIATRLGIIRRVVDTAGPLSGRYLSFADEASLPANLAVGALIVLVVTSSFVLIPIKMNQSVHDPVNHDAAIEMRTYAAGAGLTDAENYVFSEWDKSRFFNYHVSGLVFAGTTGEGHGRKQSWVRQHYTPFLASSDEDEWYELLISNGAGFVVTHDLAGDYPPGALHSRLHLAYGSRAGTVPGLAHFRFVYASPDGSTKAFALVEGATIVGNAPNATPVEVSTTIRTESGREITYTRVGQPNQDGVFRVVVANPGRYRVGNQSVTVSEADVRSGSNVTVQDP